ncbi:MAG: NFACT family protein [Candidatus Thermoplasmatota archaeon]|nr:NFACT family protein [Candidatus Thermoplasmatota archaeon]MBS3801629.1 NFACT family protein [Candidatus Thermoplasmatota archaeon]
MNQQLAALDIYTIVFELQDLIGSYIDKIYQLSNDVVIIRVNNRESKQKEILYANRNGVFFRTNQSFETPMKPTTFAMTLRKHITNGRITSIEQHEFDRIIKIKIQKRETYTLLFELIPNGNSMLLNQDGRILMPLKHQHWSQRSIRTNIMYQPPPSQVNPFTISFKDFDSLLKESDADLVRTCAVKLSLGGRYAEEFCNHLSIPKETLAEDLSVEQRKQIYTQLQQFLQPFKEHKFSPTLVIDNDKKIIIPFPFTIYKNKENKALSSFSEGIKKNLDVNTQQIKISPLEKKKEKIIRQKKQQERAIKDFDKKIHDKKHQGDIIYLHYQTIEQLISQIQKNRKLLTKKELETILNQKEIVKEYSPDSPLLTLLLPDEHKNITPIKIDYRKSVAENAELSYKKSKKLARKKQGAINALEKTKQKISSLEKQEENHIQQQLKQNQNKQKSQKQFWFEKYRWCISSNGNLILGGKDAKTNDQLIKKHLEKEDRYAHADIHGAPSCILKNKDVEGKPKDFSEEAVQEACTFSACYSRSWKQFAEAQAYWVLPNQVSKTPQSGEFVPKGAFIIRGKRNYCTCKMQIGIGIINIEEAKKIMGGPPSAIKKWCEHYVIIEPGTKKSSSIAKEISDFLNSTPTLIQKVLPPGESRIISTSKT